MVVVEDLVVVVTVMEEMLVVATVMEDMEVIIMVMENFHEEITMTKMATMETTNVSFNTSNQHRE